jgi:hypothetical protein
MKLIFWNYLLPLHLCIFLAEITHFYDCHNIGKFRLKKAPILYYCLLSMLTNICVLSYQIAPDLFHTKNKAAILGDSLAYENESMSQNSDILLWANIAQYVQVARYTKNTKYTRAERICP